jgi:hypothetical protein
MTTKDLIDAANQAQAALDAAKSAVQSAAAQLQQAQANFDAASQALHDDLAANGPAAVVDDTVSPPTVTVYTALDPDSYQATVIRTAA